ncbi:MAG: class I SAM-dependent methyltransferase [bacterium]|nr:class I SAM-dependent methyltransferase [bacterium]
MAEAWYHAAFGAFYPVVYGHRDDAEARRCLALLPRLAALPAGGGERVLDLGCGDGRHLGPLASAGLAATGLDLSDPLLRAARAREDGVPLVRADMRALPFGDGSFAAVLSLFTAFGYFGPEGGDREMVAGIARVLAPGGHWYLDYLDADRVRDELGPAVRERQRVAGPLRVLEIRRLDGDAVAKEVRLTALPGREAEAGALGVGPHGIAYTERVALYTLSGLDALAATGGLWRVAGAGDYDGAPLGAGTRWVLAYRRGTRP